MILFVDFAVDEALFAPLTTAQLIVKVQLSSDLPSALAATTGGSVTVVVLLGVVAIKFGVPVVLFSLGRLVAGMNTREPRCRLVELIKRVEADD